MFLIKRNVTGEGKDLCSRFKHFIETPSGAIRRKQKDRQDPALGMYTP